MIDAGGDLQAILSDCGCLAKTTDGDIEGQFLEEPIEIEQGSGQIVLSIEPVFYTSRLAIAAVHLVRNAWIEIEGDRWFVQEIPRADTTGLVRIRLKK